MTTRTSIAIGSLTAAGLMVLALWTWQAAPQLAETASRPDVARWAVRTAAVSAAALAQAVVLLLVIASIYRGSRLDILLRLLTVAVFAVALISAVALGLAGTRG